jgi:hypothetical protein
MKPRLSLSPFDQTSATPHSSPLPNRITASRFHAHIPFVNRDAQCKQLIKEIAAQYASSRGTKATDFDQLMKRFILTYSAGAPGIGKDYLSDIYMHYS